jgi:hypothetical protein
MDHFPGAKELYNSYANVANKNVVISPVEYANTIKQTFKLSRFLVDGMSSFRLTSTGIPVFAAVLWNGSEDAAGAREGLTILPLLKDTGGIAGIIELTENTNLNFSKEKLARVVGPPPSSIENINRNHMQVMNILDAGIVPLNVHAFMREVPFVNLLNYAYTFDRMIHEFVIPNYLNDKDVTIDNLLMKPDSPAESTREMMVKLLVYPYANLDKPGEYTRHLANLMNGNDDLKIGRPRYLSDQLWHKALLTSSAQVAQGVSQEAGPSAYEAIRSVVNFKTGRKHPIDYSPAEIAVGGTGLKYWDDKTWTATNMPATTVAYCSELGRMRFDTKIVRNLTWFVQLQRIMRVVLTNHLSWLNTPVVRGLKIADSKITEFEGNEKFEDADFDGTKYSVI